MSEKLKQRTVFIINPLSGNGQGSKMIAIIKDIMTQHQLPYEMMMTEYPLHAQEIARSYRQGDHVRLIAVGGDGTVNEVLNGINVGVPFGIIPSGSGNDFFRMITNQSVDLKTLLVDTLMGEVQLIDYGIMNGRKFLNSCSIGFDAMIAKEAKQLQSKLPRKGGSYMAAALKALIHPTKMHATLELVDQTIRQDMMLLSAMNGRWYGNGFCPAPTADLKDGLMEVSVINDLNTFQILPLFPKYMKGRHTDDPAVSIHRVNRFTLHTDQPAHMQLDGELFVDTRFELEVVHQGLSLLVPKGEAYGQVL